jgi:hypothetical protein
MAGMSRLAPPISERPTEEYARNQCRNAPQRYTGSNLVDVGRERCVRVEGGGELSGPVKPAFGKATVEVCGVAVAMPLGQSWGPPRSREQQ